MYRQKLIKSHTITEWPTTLKARPGFQWQYYHTLYKAYSTKKLKNTISFRTQEMERLQGTGYKKRLQDKTNLTGCLHLSARPQCAVQHTLRSSTPPLAGCAVILDRTRMYQHVRNGKQVVYVTIKLFLTKHPRASKHENPNRATSALQQELNHKNRHQHWRRERAALWFHTALPS